MTQTRQNWFRNLTIASTVKYYPSNFIMDSKFLSNKTHEVKFLKQIKFYVTLFACFPLFVFIFVQKPPIYYQ